MQCELETGGVHRLQCSQCRLCRDRLRQIHALPSYSRLEQRWHTAARTISASMTTTSFCHSFIFFPPCHLRTLDVNKPCVFINESWHTVDLAA